MEKKTDKIQFDELTLAIAEHNTSIAETIKIAQDSLVSAKIELARAESSLESLKEFIVTTLKGDKK